MKRCIYIGASGFCPLLHIEVAHGQELELEEWIYKQLEYSKLVQEVKKPASVNKKEDE